MSNGDSRSRLSELSVTGVEAIASVSDAVLFHSISASSRLARLLKISLSATTLVAQTFGYPQPNVTISPA